MAEAGIGANVVQTSRATRFSNFVSRNKKPIIAVLIVLLVVIIVVLVVHFGWLKPKQNQVMLIVSNDCAGCPKAIEEFNTYWRDPNNIDAKTTKVSIVNRDTKNGRKLCDKYKIDVFPSLLAIDKSGAFFIVSPSPDENPMAKISDFLTQDELVLYYAQWCGHSKTFLPIWKNFAKQSNLNIQTKLIDCDTEEGKELCAKYNVTGYPTVLLHKSAQPDKPIVFNGERTVAGLNAFIKANTK
jgi:thiol-disulfide isomerase/thioredoxin